MILIKEITITLGVRNTFYFESLGYLIPKYFNKRKKKFFVKRGTKIKVKISDLPKETKIKVPCECDVCKIQKLVFYCSITNKPKYICLDCCHKTKEFKNKISIGNTGKVRSKEFKKNISIKNSGENNYWYGKTGENSPLWNPNLTDIERKRNSFEIQNWVKKVKQRDNYTCQKCGYVGKKYDGMMVAHHKENFKNFKELRTNIDNGITLCKDCHCSNKGLGIHNKFGRTPNNENLNEFLHNVNL